MFRKVEISKLIPIFNIQKETRR